MLHNLYTALIRPHLDYACVIWNPYQLGDIRILERVQRSATLACLPLRHLPYNDQLVALNLPSLMYRRRRMDMIMMYKILATWFGWNSYLLMHCLVSTTLLLNQMDISSIKIFAT